MPAHHVGTEALVGTSPSRSIRVAGYLAVLFGIFGALSGFAAAGTFIPFRNVSTYNSQFAGVLTAIAVLGAVISVLGIVAGWGLLRTKGWAWGLTLGVAAGCVGSVAAMTAFWPGSWGFLLVVGLAYAFEVGLVLLGRGAFRVRTGRASPA